MTTLIALRFFCGVFGSSGPALGVATCADVSHSGMTEIELALTDRADLGARGTRTPSQYLRHRAHGMSTGMRESHGAENV